ncbi:unnamed protein product, partial [Heterosigma akashiwo]
GPWDRYGTTACRKAKAICSTLVVTTDTAHSREQRPRSFHASASSRRGAKRPRPNPVSSRRDIEGSCGTPAQTKARPCCAEPELRREVEEVGGREAAQGGG